MTAARKFVVLGASGHIGSVVVRELLAHGNEVIAIIHDAAKGDELQTAGAEIAVVDLLDSQSLRSVFQKGRRAFLLNPPAPVDGDTDVEENRTASSIADAVGGTGLEKIVVASTYGARPGEAIGDLSVLWNFEHKVGAAAIPMAINRGAYYFTNLDALVDGARQGTITTMFPRNLKIPMVAPAGLGSAAAARLMAPVEDDGIEFVKGPERYSFADVAAAFADALGHAVRVETMERDKWFEFYRHAGFSPEAARAYTRMMEASLEGLDLPERPTRTSTNLRTYVANLVKKSAISD